MTMTRHLKGCYLDLLVAQFNSGPLSLEEIKTVLGNDFAAWQGSLSKKFRQTSAGLFFNEKLANEMKNRAEYSGKQRDRAVEGWKKRKADDANAYAAASALCEDENEDEVKDEIGVEVDPFGNFVEQFNLITGRDFRGGDKARKQYATRTKEGYTLEIILRAVQNCMNDPYHVQHPHHLTPEFITRQDKLEKYANYIKPIIDGTGKFTPKGGPNSDAASLYNLTSGILGGSKSA